MFKHRINFNKIVSDALFYAYRLSILVLSAIGAAILVFYPLSFTLPLLLAATVGVITGKILGKILIEATQALFRIFKKTPQNPATNQETPTVAVNEEQQTKTIDSTITIQTALNARKVPIPQVLINDGRSCTNFTPYEANTKYALEKKGLQVTFIPKPNEITNETACVEAKEDAEILAFTV